VIFGSSDVVEIEHGLGWSITSPFKTIEHGAERAGKDAVHVAKKVASNPIALLATFPPAALVKYVAKPLGKLALRPVTHRIDTLKDRRAKKLAWDRRKSTVPTSQDRNDARSWAKGYLRGHKPPFGLMLSMLAGPPSVMPTLGSGGFGDPTAATIAASIPALMALMTSILHAAHQSGQAPEHAGSSTASPQTPDAPGTQDLTPVQNAVDDAAAAAGGDVAPGDDASSGAAGKHGKGKRGLLGGITHKQLLIGGGVLGGVVLLVLLTGKKK